MSHGDTGTIRWDDPRNQHGPALSSAGGPPGKPTGKRRNTKPKRKPRRRKTKR